MAVEDTAQPKKGEKMTIRRQVSAFLQKYDDMEESSNPEKERNEDLFYHVALIDLLTSCCKDFNHGPEAMAQNLIPFQECYEIIRHPETDVLVKSAYCRFTAEVWMYTERATELRESDEAWDLLQHLVEELQTLTKKK
jgi:hypothetical protein